MRDERDLPLTLTSDADEDRCRFKDCEDALFDNDGDELF